MNTQILNLKQQITAQLNERKNIDELREKYNEILWAIADWNEENEYLNFEDDFYSNEEAIKTLKSIGIKEFSYSCSSTGALRDFADFDRLGFKIKSTLTIKTKRNDEKPAVLFVQNEK